MKKTRPLWLALVIAAFLGSAVIPSFAQSSLEVLAQIERLASRGRKGDDDLSRSIAGQIEKDPSGIGPLLLPRL